MSSRPQPVTSTQLPSSTLTLANCACCNGSGLHGAGVCPACAGSARVEAQRYLAECAGCKGSGIQGGQPAYYAQLCTGCYGTGWITG